MGRSCETDANSVQILLILNIPLSILRPIKYSSLNGLMFSGINLMNVQYTKINQAIYCLGVGIGIGIEVGNW